VTDSIVPKAGASVAACSRELNEPLGDSKASGDLSKPVIPRSVGAGGADDPQRPREVQNMIRRVAERYQLDPRVTQLLLQLYGDAAKADPDKGTPLGGPPG
jgi:hypothetical protein